MQQKMPWDEDWSQPDGATASTGGYPTITIPRDPRLTAREDSAAIRAAADQRLQQQAAARDQIRFGERNKPSLPAGYMMGPDGRTAVRIPGLPPEKTDQPGKPDLDSVRAEALDKIKLARTLQQRSKDGWFATGFGASTMGKVGGTGAYDVRQDTETLKNAGALTRIMEMAKTNGGKNPLTPLSNSDFQALASSLSNLETAQSDGQYQRNVQRVIDLYSRAYQGAGGKDLEGDLDPSKRKKAGPLSAVPAASGGIPPAGQGGPDGYTGGGGGQTIATGATRTERDDKASALIDTLVRRGAGIDEINAAIAPMGMKPVAPEQFAAVQKYLAANPGYKGSFGEATRELPTTGWNRFAASPVGTGIYAGVDAAMGGTTDEIASLMGGGDLADLNARKQAAFAANPGSALAGQVIGTIGGMATLGAAGRGAGLAGRFAVPQLAGDIAFGAVSGAGQSNDNRLIGGALGAAGGLVGNVVGAGAANTVGAVARTKAGLAATNRIRGMFGSGAIPRIQRVEGADRALLGAVDRAGLPNIETQLGEAQSMGMPMSLADTNPNLRELAGAAVRRSPTAATYAEDALIPRNRGQYDRFMSSVESNLGPTTNIPQRSADMMAQARTGASDLYDKAYGNPVPSTPELDAVLGTPFGRTALSRANTIAANERRSPTELGFAQDAQGNTLLNPQPNRAIANHLSARDELNAAQDAYRAARTGPGNKDAALRWVEQAREAVRQAERGLAQSPDPALPANVPGYTTESLDYVKRGMDDVLEEKRNPITGKLVLDEAGRAQNGVRGQLLNEVDRLNPDFAQARSAYAGPMASRDALARGGDAYGLPSDELGMQVANQTPEHLDQMQLGYRGALVDHASKVRDSGNPWEATLGAPDSRNRLETMYPNNPGVARMLRQRDLEGRMQQTKDGVIGNSKTAGRQIMDKVFDGGGWPVALGEAGLAVLTHGATLPLALRRFAGENARDAFKLGIGSRAVAKADDLAPKLLNPDPAAALATARELLAQQQAWRELVATTKPKGLGMFGRGFGSQSAVTPMNR